MGSGGFVRPAVLIDGVYGMTLDKGRGKAVVPCQDCDSEEFGVYWCEKIAGHSRFGVVLSLFGSSSSRIGR